MSTGGFKETQHNYNGSCPKSWAPFINITIKTSIFI